MENGKRVVKNELLNQFPDMQHTLSLSKAQENFDCPTSNLILIKFLHKIEIIGTLNKIKVVAPDPQYIIEVKYILFVQ